MILPYGHCCQDTKTLTLVNKYNTRKDSSSPPTSRRRCRRSSSFLYLRCVFLSRYNFTPPHFQSNSAHATHARENVKSPKNATPPTQFPRRYTFSPIVIHTTNSSPESESFINPRGQSAFFWPSSTTTHSSSRDTHTSAAVFAVRFLSSFVVFAARLSYVKNATQKIA